LGVLVQGIRTRNPFGADWYLHRRASPVRVDEPAPSRGSSGRERRPAAARSRANDPRTRQLALVRPLTTLHLKPVTDSQTLGPFAELPWRDPTAASETISGPSSRRGDEVAVRRSGHGEGPPDSRNLALKLRRLPQGLDEVELTTIREATPGDLAGRAHHVASEAKASVVDEEHAARRLQRPTTSWQSGLKC
jgi:hypothetical protein